METSIVIADTSVLINFLRIDRMDLIGAHPFPFIVTDHVAEEVSESYADQRGRLDAALAAGHLTQQSIDTASEVEIFLRLGQRGRLGSGERSAIAVALHRGWTLAIDDSRAIKRAIQEADLSDKPLPILRTRDVMVQLIEAGIIDIARADAIKDDWRANHRFALAIRSFADLLG
jgi:predicted nucleic acid-binding protein